MWSVTGRGPGNGSDKGVGPWKKDVVIVSSARRGSFDVGGRGAVSFDEGKKVCSWASYESR